MQVVSSELVSVDWQLVVDHLPVDVSVLLLLDAVVNCTTTGGCSDRSKAESDGGLVGLNDAGDGGARK